jgi:hypothetical protein
VAARRYYIGMGKAGNDRKRKQNRQESHGTTILLTLAGYIKSAKKIRPKPNNLDYADFRYFPTSLSGRLTTFLAFTVA